MLRLLALLVTRTSDELALLLKAPQNYVDAWHVNRTHVSPLVQSAVV